MKTVQSNHCLRIHTREVLEKVRWGGKTYQITTFGTPVAVLVPIEEYARLTGATTSASAEGAPANRAALSVPRGMSLVPEEAEG